MPRTAKAVILSEVERATLTQMARYHPKWYARRRAQTVLLLGAGCSLSEVASRQDIDKDTVAFHRDAWLERGLVGLRDLPRDGRPRQLFLAEEASLCQWATQEALTARDLQSRLAAEHEKQVSVAVIKAALVRNGFVWKRTRYSLKQKRDEVEFRKAQAEIREMLEKLRPATKDDDDRNGGGSEGDNEGPSGEKDAPPPLVMAYVDEAGFDPTQPNRSGWAPVGEVHSIMAGRGKRLNVLAALLSTNELFSVKLWCTTTALLFVGFLGLLLKHVGGPLLVILDNASIHKAKEISGLLELLKENGLVLYFLPPYSPELNRIERFWHKMKYELMAFKHRTTEELEAAVDKALAGFGIEYQFTF